MSELLLTPADPHLIVGVGPAPRESEARSEASVASYASLWLLTRLDLSFDEAELGLIRGNSEARKYCRSVSLKVTLRESLER